MQKCYSKTNRMLGLISRTTVCIHPSVLLNLYKSFIRPNLDHRSSVWNPHYKKDKELLECVQHRFTRSFPNLKGLVYEDRLRQLGLWSLEERQNIADLIELFQVLKGFSATPWSTFFQLNKDSVTRGHSLKLRKTHSHCEVRSQFFSQRVINRWNSLSQEDVDAPSVNAYKGRLDKGHHCQMDIFIDWLSTSLTSCTISNILAKTTVLEDRLSGAAAPGQYLVSRPGNTKGKQKLNITNRKWLTTSN